MFKVGNDETVLQIKFKRLNIIANSKVIKCGQIFFLPAHYFGDL